MDESFIAFVTFIRLHPSVNQLMLGEVCAPVKTFPAIAALVRSLSNVNSLMDSEG